jgi:hypothetical protein
LIREQLIMPDIANRRDDEAGQQDRPRREQPVPATSSAVQQKLDPDADALVAADRPRGLLSKLDARTRSLLTGAAIAAVLVNAGAVWAYWHITGSETGRANAGVVVELTLRGRSDLNKPLTPGSTGDLTVAVANDNDFPIRVTSVTPAPGTIMADDEHRENGCVDHGVAITQSAVQVEWDVARNNVGAFTVPGGLAMATTSEPACAGAVFTVPVLVKGTAGVS